MSSLEQKAKTKVVILGSCKHAPYEVLLVPNPFDKKLYVKDHEKAYAEACKRFYPAIKEADVVFVYAPDGVGEHTKRDLNYAKSCGKLIGIASKEAQQEIDERELTISALRNRLGGKQYIIEKLESERSELKQKLRDLLKTCPLVPTLTTLSMAERSTLLGEHSVLLDEWYQKLKRELLRNE